MPKRIKRYNRYRRKRISAGHIALIGLLLVLVVATGLIINKIIYGGAIDDPAKTADGSGPEGSGAIDVIPTPEPDIFEMLTLTPSESANPAQYGFSSELMIHGEAATSFSRETPISFKRGSEYTQAKGIITFGGNNYRDTFTYGVQQVNAKTLTRIWEKDTGSLNTESNGTWTGTGWTGMPLIVEWSEEVRKTLGVAEKFKSMQGFTEVIYPTMDGKIYFYELQTGEKTREPINIKMVTKGTASLDPRGYPLLYTGQGIPGKEENNSGSWMRIISLIENKVIWKFGGTDPFSYRKWQAYDSSPLISAETDTLIQPGENGVLYTVKLNSSFDAAAGTVSVNPGKLEKYKYKADGYGFNEESDKRWVGIENSVSAWKNYLFFTDNGGYLQCLDVNTFELQYATAVTDDSDTSPVLEEDKEARTLYLYTANEVDKQSGVSGGVGKSYHRKINALTGEIVWEKLQEASVGNTSSNGGTLTTPHVGKGSISDLVIYNSTLVPVTVDGAVSNGGRIIAYDKNTGSEVWRYEQKDGYWSSPVVIYDEATGTAYVLQCDRGGMLRMHDARTGNVVTELNMGSRIESTPAVFNNILVVGTRGTNGQETQKILAVKIG